MEENKYKFRLRLNLFDGIILVVALAVAAVLLWMAVKPQAVSNESSTAAATVRYTIRFQRWIEGTGSIIQPGGQTGRQHQEQRTGPGGVHPGGPRPDTASGPGEPQLCTGRRARL